MGKDKDFSVCIQSGHVLSYFFMCCLFLFESIRKKRENKTHGKISHSAVIFRTYRVTIDKFPPHSCSRQQFYHGKPECYL